MTGTYYVTHSYPPSPPSEPAPVRTRLSPTAYQTSQGLDLPSLPRRLLLKVQPGKGLSHITRHLTSPVGDGMPTPAATAALLFSGLVFLPRLPELWGLFDRPGRRGLLGVAALATALRLLPHLRARVERSVSVWAVPSAAAVCLAGAAWLQRRGRTVAAQTVLRQLLVVATPLSIAAALDDVAGADVIALLGLLMGLGLGHQYSAVILLLMVTGGEALEDYASDRAGRTLGLLLDRRMPPTAMRRVVGSPDSTASTSAAAAATAATAATTAKPSSRLGSPPCCDDSSRAAQYEEVPVSSVLPGDVLMLREGGVVPVDCDIVAGGCIADDSMVTGETLATERLPRLVQAPILAPPAPLAFPRLVQASLLAPNAPLASLASLAPQAPQIPLASSSLLSGSVLQSTTGTVLVEATRCAGDSTFALMTRALEQAYECPAPMERKALHMAAMFTPLTLLAAALSMARMRYSRRPMPIREQWATVLSVLSASTNCPLAIGVPVSLLSGMSAARHAGLTIKSGEAVEGLGNATMVVFDKTGTLTQGAPSLAHARMVRGGNYDARQLIALAHSVENSSNHIIAVAFRTHVEAVNREGEAESRGGAGRGEVEESVRTCMIPLHGVVESSIVSQPGRGISADVQLAQPVQTVHLTQTVQGGGGGEGGASIGERVTKRVKRVDVGSLAFMAELGVNIRPMDSEDSGEEGSSSSSSLYLPIYVAVDGVMEGCILFEDALRSNSKELIARLLKRQLRLAILSGDTSGRLSAVAEELGIKVREGGGEATGGEAGRGARGTRERGRRLDLIGAIAAMR